MNDSETDTGSSASVLAFGPFTLDGSGRRLARGAASRHLTPKAFELLWLLVHEAPRVLTKRELHAHLWPDTFVTDASLAELIKEVRRALDDHDRSAPIVRTVHRVGYALCLEVRRVAPAPPASPRHWLVFRHRRVPLPEGEHIIGRDPSAGVLLDAASVSRRHARITIAGPDARLEDLGSKNGTAVGDTPVRDATRLRDGDRLSFGGIVAVYRSSAVSMTTATGVVPQAPDHAPQGSRHGSAV